MSYPNVKINYPSIIPDLYINNRYIYTTNDILPLINFDTSLSLPSVKILRSASYPNSPMYVYNNKPNKHIRYYNIKYNNNYYGVMMSIISYNSVIGYDCPHDLYYIYINKETNDINVSHVYTEFYQTNFYSCPLSIHNAEKVLIFKSELADRTEPDTVSNVIDNARFIEKNLITKIENPISSLSINKYFKYYPITTPDYTRLNPFVPIIFQLSNKKIGICYITDTLLNSLNFTMEILDDLDSGKTLDYTLMKFSNIDILDENYTLLTTHNINNLNLNSTSSLSIDTEKVDKNNDYEIIYGEVNNMHIIKMNIDEKLGLTKG